MTKLYDRTEPRDYQTWEVTLGLQHLDDKRLQIRRYKPDTGQVMLIVDGNRYVLPAHSLLNAILMVADIDIGQCGREAR